MQTSTQTHARTHARTHIRASRTVVDNVCSLLHLHHERALALDQVVLRPNLRSMAGEKEREGGERGREVQRHTHTHTHTEADG